MSRNPSTAPIDTPIEVRRRHLAAIAARSMTERLEEWAALNREMARLESAGVRVAHPDYTDHEVFLTLVHRRYGDRTFREAWPGAVLPDG